MTIERKTLTAGFSLPVFGMGTWMMGGSFTRDPNNDGEADAAALRAGLERGLTHIDTAEMYAGGFAETIVGRAINGFDRAKIQIVTKVWNTDLSYDGVLRAAEGSARRLGVDYIDLYLVHKPDDAFPLKDTVRALDRLADEKIVKAIGVSNFAVERLKRAQAFASHKIVANQVHYNLIYRGPEREGLLAYCQENDVLVIAWRPVQKGLIAVENPVLAPICRKYGKSPAQVAINWLISQPAVVTMSTMRSENHLDENLGALGWRLDAEDIEALRRDYPDQRAVSDVVPLS